MKSAHTREKLAFFILGVITFIVILPILLTIFYIVKNGIGTVNWEFIAQYPRNGMKEGGILPAIVGTVYLTVSYTHLTLPTNREV